MFCSHTVWICISIFHALSGKIQYQHIYLYYVQKILAAKIRSNKNIKGIKINNTEIKHSQSADDTTAYLDGSQKSLEETLNELDIFSNTSELRTNFDKTQLNTIHTKHVVVRDPITAPIEKIQ